jgi:hypothetical protein
MQCCRIFCWIYILTDITQTFWHADSSMFVRFTFVGNKFSLPLFLTSRILHPTEVVIFNDSSCFVDWGPWVTCLCIERAFLTRCSLLMWSLGWFLKACFSSFTSLNSLPNHKFLARFREKPLLFPATFQIAAQWGIVSDTSLGCRLRVVKTMVVRILFSANVKSVWNICQNVNSTENTATLQILQKIRWSPLYFNRETFI